LTQKANSRGPRPFGTGAERGPDIGVLIQPERPAGFSSGERAQGRSRGEKALRQVPEVRRAFDRGQTRAVLRNFRVLTGTQGGEQKGRLGPFDVLRAHDPGQAACPFARAHSPKPRQKDRRIALESSPVQHGWVRAVLRKPQAPIDSESGSRPKS